MLPSGTSLTETQSTSNESGINFSPSFLFSVAKYRKKIVKTKEEVKEMHKNQGKGDSL